jgi:hypothetical protein
MGRILRLRMVNTTRSTRPLSEQANAANRGSTSPGRLSAVHPRSAEKNLLRLLDGNLMFLGAFADVATVPLKALHF